MNRKKKENSYGNTRDLGQPRQFLAESIIITASPCLISIVTKQAQMFA